MCSSMRLIPRTSIMVSTKPPWATTRINTVCLDGVCVCVLLVSAYVCVCVCVCVCVSVDMSECVGNL